MKKSIIVLFKFGIFIWIITLMSCEKDITNPVQPNDDYLILNDYTEPDYPEKAAGQYLDYIYYEYHNSGYPFLSGKKVDFVYNEKNYVDYFVIFGTSTNSCGRRTYIEYDINGNAIRIKYFLPDSTIASVDQINYDDLQRVSKISRYDKVENEEKFKLAYFSEFSYPSIDSIIELRFLEYYSFERPYKDIYLFDSIGNVKEKQSFYYGAGYPYLSSEFIYTDMKRAFDGLNLPIYEIAHDRFQLHEVFSRNHSVGFRNYKYENDSVRVGIGSREQEWEYDEKGYPISRDETVFYYYTELN